MFGYGGVDGRMGSKLGAASYEGVLEWGFHHLASRGQWHPMCIDFPVYFLIVISIVAWINKFIASFYFFLSQCTLKTW